MKKKAKILGLLLALALVTTFAFSYPARDALADSSNAIAWEAATISNFRIKEVAKTSDGLQITVDAYTGGKNAIVVGEDFFTGAAINADTTVNGVAYTKAELLNKKNTVVFGKNSLTGVKYLHITQKAPVAGLEGSCFGSYATGNAPTVICENRNVSFGSIGTGAKVYAYAYSENELNKQFKGDGGSNNVNTEMTSAYEQRKNYVFYSLPEITPGNVSLVYDGTNLCDSNTVFKFCTELTNSLENKATPITNTDGASSVLSNYNYAVSCENAKSGKAVDTGKYAMVATASFLLDADNQIDLSQAYTLEITPITVSITPCTKPTQATDGVVDEKTGTIYGETSGDASVSYVTEKAYDGTAVADSNLNHFNYTFGDTKGTLSLDVLKNIKENLKDLFSIKATYADEVVGDDKDITFAVTCNSKNFSVADTKSVKGAITKAAITIDDLAVAEKTYDGSTEATLTGKLSGVADTDSFDLSVVPAYFADSNVGSNKVVSLDKDAFESLMEKKYPNYSLTIDDSNLVGNIVAKTLTATVEPVQIYQGSGIPDLDVTVTGFANGESAASLAGFVYPTATTTATATSGTGNYPITVSGGTPTANYVFDYVNGTLNVADAGAVAAYSIYDTYVQNATSTAVSINSVMNNGTLVEAESYGWTTGKKDINFFKTGKATIGTTFTAVSSKQWYTLYAKVGANIIYKYEQFPVLSDQAAEPKAVTPVVTPTADTVAPTLTVSKSTTKATKKNVKLYVTASDNVGVAAIKVNGVSYPVSSLTITVKKNKKITITALDAAGNATTKKVTVKNIDKKKPTITAKVTAAKNVKITVKDNKTKAKKLAVRYAKGYKTASKWKSAKTAKAFKATRGKVYTVFCRDAVGNVSTYHFKVTRTCKVKIRK